MSDDSIIYKGLTYCEVGKHEIVEPRKCYRYWDEEHNFKNTVICDTCYARHILAFYPESKMAIHINANPGLYGLVSE